MIINSSFNWKGQVIKVKYSDLDSFTSIHSDKCKQVYGVCFYGKKIVIVKGESGEDGTGWGLPGGHPEKGETFEQTLIREVQEETNMRVLSCIPIGVQEVTTPTRETEFQLRYYATVEPIRKFEKDPAGSVTEIKLIDPRDYKKYFDWGQIGERIIQRAIEMSDKY